MDHEFNKIYLDNFYKVYLFVYNLTHDKQFSEDISQEAFIRAYQKFNSFRNESKPHKWINKIAYNIFIDYKRKKRVKEVPENDEILEQVKTIHNDDLINDLEKNIMSDCIKTRVSSLPENYRAVLSLDMAGYDNKEIAEILNCSLENVKVRLFRGKNKLKTLLSSNCDFYNDHRNVLS